MTNYRESYAHFSIDSFRFNVKGNLSSHHHNTKQQLTSVQIVNITVKDIFEVFLFFFFLLPVSLKLNQIFLLLSKDINGFTTSHLDVFSCLNENLITWIEGYLINTWKLEIQIVWPPPLVISFYYYVCLYSFLLWKNRFVLESIYSKMLTFVRMC